MSEFRAVTPAFSVAPHLSLDDVARAAADGFTLIIANRPDNESPGQPTMAKIEAAAKAHGLGFKALPFTLPTPPATVAETAETLGAAQGPVLAYCRTGTRSVTAWALAQALQGAHRPDELIAMAAQAGYDLSGVRGALERLAPAQ